MKTKHLLVFLLLLGFFSACKKDKEETPPKTTCPEITTNLDIPQGALGDWKLLFEGNDGMSKDGISLRYSCSWFINGLEDGGVGNTFALRNADTSLVMRWANNRLSEFELLPGWQGVTEKGIALGDSLGKVQAAYPALQVISPYTDRYGFTTGNIEVTMEFDVVTWKLLDIYVIAKY